MGSTSGGSFLVQDGDAAHAGPFPESFGNDQRDLHDSARTFGEQMVRPHRDALERHDMARLAELMRTCGEQGYFGVGIPERYGGFGLDLTDECLVTRGVGRSGETSFLVTHCAQTGIGTCPILHFGTEAQKSAWLPKLASGEAVASYAVTEPDCGTDMLSAKTAARLSEDGTQWILNGSKLFITNAGVSSVFTVLANVDGKHACFIVERGEPGFAVGKEERKMGIRGSSTCPLYFDDARIPRENLLGEVGRGHVVVMNTINLGRLKIGAAALGGVSYALDMAVRHCAERKQFGLPLIAFDAVKAKIAEMAIDEWIGEAMVFRLAGDMSRALRNCPSEAEVAKTIKAFELECAIVKVALTEMFWRSADHLVQLFGGYGFIEDFEPAPLQRDARIFRIFEGTSEVLRLHTALNAIKLGHKGEIDLDLNGDVGANGMVSSHGIEPQATPLRQQQRAVRNLTRWGLRAFAQQCQRTYAQRGDMANILAAASVEAQQPLLALADMMLATYATDCALTRLAAQPFPPTDLFGPMIARAYQETANATALDGTHALISAATPRMAVPMAHALETRARMEIAPDFVDVMALKRDIADAVVRRTLG